MAKIHFLNVKEGDCSIIQHNNGHVTMIDVCNAKDPKSEISEDVEFQNISDDSFSQTIPQGNFHQKNYPENPAKYLKSLGVRSIFRYIQTHPDMDHMDGLQYIKDHFDIINFWDTANTKKQNFSNSNGKYNKNDWECYQQLRKSATNPKSLNYFDGSENKYFAIDDLGKKEDDYLQILAPTQSLVQSANQSSDWNDVSYVILYHICGRKVLFCGDAGGKTLEHIIEKHQFDISDLDVLVAPHHGRIGTLDFSFLDVMRPKITLMGNALSKNLAYQQLNNRKLFHVTNNQVGNVIIEIDSKKMQVFCSNKKFAEQLGSMNDLQVVKHSSLEAWMFLTV